jgi:hypothetical protein
VAGNKKVAQMMKRTTRLEMERLLIDSAKRHRLRPGTDRFNSYVYGKLDEIFPRTHGQRITAARKAVRTKRKEGLLRNPDKPGYRLVRGSSEQMIYSKREAMAVFKKLPTDIPATLWNNKTHAVIAYIEDDGHKVVVENKGEKIVKSNPVTPHTSQRQMNVIKAIQLYQKFRLQDPRFVDTVDYPMYREMAVIGRCDGLLYTTTRRDRTESYKHEFTGKSKPLLCASFDGKQLYLIGGAYNFTERGIVDSKPDGVKNRRRHR